MCFQVSSGERSQELKFVNSKPECFVSRMLLLLWTLCRAKGKKKRVWLGFFSMNPWVPLSLTLPRSIHSLSCRHRWSCTLIITATITSCTIAKAGEETLPALRASFWDSFLTHMGDLFDSFFSWLISDLGLSLGTLRCREKTYINLNVWEGFFSSKWLKEWNERKLLLRWSGFSFGWFRVLQTFAVNPRGKLWPGFLVLLLHIRESTPGSVEAPKMGGSSVFFGSKAGRLICDIKV